MRLATLQHSLATFVLLFGAGLCVGAVGDRSMAELIAQGKKIDGEKAIAEAIQALDEALRREPDNVEALRSRGRARALTKTGEGAMDDVNRAVELAPKSADCRFDRAMAKIYRDGNLQGAITDFDEAASLATPGWLLLNNRGFCKLRLKRYEDAAKDFEAALKQEPKRADLHQFLGECRYSLGEYETALTEYERAIALSDKPTTRLWYTAAEACYELKKYRKAIEYVTKSIGAKNLTPDEGDDWCYSMIGHCHLALGEFDLALANYDKAIEVRPSQGSYQYCRGQALSHLGRQSDADEAFAKASKLGYKP